MAFTPDLPASSSHRVASLVAMSPRAAPRPRPGRPGRPSLLCFAARCRPMGRRGAARPAPPHPRTSNRPRRRNLERITVPAHAGLAQAVPSPCPGRTASRAKRPGPSRRKRRGESSLISLPSPSHTHTVGRVAESTADLLAEEEQVPEDGDRVGLLQGMRRAAQGGAGRKARSRTAFQLNQSAILYGPQGQASQG